MKNNDVIKISKVLDNLYFKKASSDDVDYNEYYVEGDDNYITISIRIKDYKKRKATINKIKKLPWIDLYFSSFDSVSDPHLVTIILKKKLIEKNNPGGDMDSKKLLTYGVLVAVAWYAWQMWQKKKLGSGVQSALTQGNSVAQQMVSFI